MNKVQLVFVLLLVINTSRAWDERTEGSETDCVLNGICKGGHEAHAIPAPHGNVLIYMIKYDGRVLSGLLSEGCLQPGCYTYNFSHQGHGNSVELECVRSLARENSFQYLARSRRQRVLAVSDKLPFSDFAPNGSVVMAPRGVQCQKPVPPAKGTREKIAIATAPHWSGPYTIRSKEPVFDWTVPDDWPLSLVTPGQMMSNEDSFIWRTSRGYHMLVHCQLKPNSETRGAYGYI